MPSIIISIVALLVSFASVYLTWTANRQTTVDDIGKLIDQYYAGQEKLDTLHEATQLNRVNILRSQLQMIGSRTVSLEQTVRQDDIDDGTRLAIAQINESVDDNLQNAETAWRTAIKNTKDISVYIYAMRSLASNQFRQNKKADAEQSYRLALDAAKSVTVKGTAIVNRMSDDAKLSQSALTHAFWLDRFASRDCPIVVPHFDSALSSIAQVSRLGPTVDFASQRRVLSARVLLYPFREAREACAPSSVAIEADDNCYLIANILDNAPSTFGIYKEDSDKAESPSRIFLSESEFCGVDAHSTFYCSWPEADEARTKMQFEKTVGVISACKNLGDPKSSPLDYTLTTGEQTKNVTFPNKVNIRIKLERSQTARMLWRVRLEIDSKVQK